jgi:hypothetical protein
LIRCSALLALPSESAELVLPERVAYLLRFGRHVLLGFAPRAFAHGPFHVTSCPKRVALVGASVLHPDSNAAYRDDSLARAGVAGEDRLTISRMVALSGIVE